jgi:hypothetical protein
MVESRQYAENSFSPSLCIVDGCGETVPGREFHPLESSAFARGTVAPVEDMAAFERFGRAGYITAPSAVRLLRLFGADTCGTISDLAVLPKCRER